MPSTDTTPTIAALDPAPQMGKPELSILVVSYNTREDTLACLASVIEHTHATRYELIVVDNASADGSAAAIRDRFPKVRLFALQENVGFARANNIASLAARGRLLLLLNPDTLVLDGALDALVAFSKTSPKAGIWGSTTLDRNRVLDPSCCFAAMTPWSLFCLASGLSNAFPGSAWLNPEAYAGWQRDSVREVDVIAGCYLLIEHRLWRRLAGFDPAFFMYGEEADLCLRAVTLGARPLFTPAAPIIHYGGASERTRAGKMIKLLAAKVTLVRRYFPRHLQPLGRALLRAWPLSRMLAFRIKAAATGSDMDREQAETWGQIWAARQSWASGFPEPGSGDATLPPRAGLGPAPGPAGV